MRYFIGLGSNLGDRLRHMQSAVAALIARGVRDVRCSSVYETSPVGVSDDQPWYLNAVIACESAHSPEELLSVLLEIEQLEGRERSRPRAARTLDLDLLMADGEVYTSSTLQVPHPRLHERLFVLTPLRELVPNLIHPVLHQTIDALYFACRAVSREVVRLYAPPFVLSTRPALTG